MENGIASMILQSIKLQKNTLSGIPQILFIFSEKLKQNESF